MLLYILNLLVIEQIGVVRSSDKMPKEKGMMISD